jgi:hypothetical protein
MALLREVGQEDCGSRQYLSVPLWRAIIAAINQPTGFSANLQKTVTG